MDTLEPKLSGTKEIKKVTKKYHLAPTVDMEEIWENGKLKTRTLKYTGKKLNPNGNRKYIQAVIVTDEFWEFIKYASPFWSGDVKWKGENVRVWDMIIQTKLEKVDMTTVKAKNLVFIYMGDHMFFDSEEKIIPLPFYGEYIGARFDNGRYHLPEMLEYLKTHPEVIQDFGPLELKLERGVEYMKICDIPHYNSERGKDKFITAFILPKQEKLQEIFDRITSEKKSTTVLKDTVLSLYDDYLGIHQFKLTDEELKAIEESSAEEDEDY